MNKRRIRTFTWDGLLWTARIPFGKQKLAVSIRAQEDEHEIVHELGGLAIRFPAFWERNSESLVDAVQQWLSYRSEKSDLRPRRCTTETIDFEGCGWVISRFEKSADEMLTYFELLVTFRDSDGVVYGEGVNIEVVGCVNDDLEITSHLRIDLTAS